MGKGMDIKLKADISELEKSLKKLNTAARLSTKELKEIEKAANLTNGKGYEFKAQKIEVLKQKLESAKLKLKELKELEEKWAAAR
jgi:phage-related minor tail protein